MEMMTTKNANKPAFGPVRLMKEEKEAEVEKGGGGGGGDGEGGGGGGGNPDSEHVNRIYHLHFCSSMKAMGEKKLERGERRRKSPGGGRGGNYDRHHKEEKTQQH